MKKLLKISSRIGIFLLAMISFVVFTTGTTVQAKNHQEGNITWKIQGKTLYIQAVPKSNGHMINYDYQYPEWNSHKKSIEKIVIKEGVTYIGNLAFKGLPNLKEVQVASTVKAVGEDAFTSCKNPKKKIVFTWNQTTAPSVNSSAFRNFAKKHKATFVVKNTSVRNALLKATNAKYVSFDVKNKTNISKVKIAGIHNKKCTGKAIKQNVIVKEGKYTLKKGRDYSVSYVNNKNGGTAKVVIKGLGCYKGTVTKTFKLTPVISTKYSCLYIGDTTKIKLIGDGGKAKWSSSKKNVATVSENGKVKALKGGKTTISATYKGKTYKCKVYVYKPYMSSTEKTMYAGQSTYLSLYNARSEQVKWKSSKPSVARVNSYGYVSLLKKGTAVVTATYHGHVYKCKFTVQVLPAITVNSINWSTNYANGVKPSIRITNNTNKIIKKIEFNTEYHDQFNDPAYCSVWGVYKKTLNAKGPVYGFCSQTFYWDVVLYNSDVSRIDIKKCTIYYTDGTKKTVDVNVYYCNSNYFY